MPGPSAHYPHGVMSGAAYVLLPVTGLLAYFTAGQSRTRFHGLQAIVLGLVWPLALYIAALGPAILVQLVFAVGALTWLAFLVLAAFGRNPRLPFVAGVLEHLAGAGLRDGR